jgi:hypothetical protein
MADKITPALQQVLDLFDQQGQWTNREIAEALAISYLAAYHRTRRLRDMGLLESGMNWKTCSAGAFAWTDENGSYRSWCSLWLSDRPDEPDAVYSWSTNKRYRENGGNDGQD